MAYLEHHEVLSYLAISLVLENVDCKHLATVENDPDHANCAV